MLKLALLLLIIHVNLTYGNHFTFDATNLVSTTDNWLHEEVPCVGDSIRFDNTLPVVAFMDHNVDVQSITLPDNGLIVFTDNGVDLGGEQKWQCRTPPGTDATKDAFFSGNTRHDTSFFNPANWDSEKHLFLHMNQVPSEYDDVTISPVSSAQIYVDLPVKVNTFKFYERQMTTDDFNLLLRSMEGQFQINLARPWAHESDQGGVQRMIAENAITVNNKELEWDSEGVVSSNSNNKTLSTICSYIQCPGTTQCIDQFIPFGHCCPVCGTRIEIVAHQLDFYKARVVVFDVLMEMEPNAEVFATFERKTMNWGNSVYEIAIISSNNITLDEEFHKKATNLIIERLAVTMITNHRQTILNVDIFSSRIDRSVKTVSKVVACLIYFTVFIVLAGMYAYRNVDLRNIRHDAFNPIIKYHRRNDDVAIEMDGVVEEEDDSEPLIPNEEPESPLEVVTKEPPLRSENEDDDVEDWRNINPNFAVASDEVENPMCFEMMETVKRPDVDSEETGTTCPEVMGSQENLIPEDIGTDEIVAENVAEDETKADDGDEEDVEDILNVNPNFVEAPEQESNADDSENSEEILNPEDVQSSEDVPESILTDSEEKEQSEEAGEDGIEEKQEAVEEDIPTSEEVMDLVQF